MNLKIKLSLLFVLLLNVGVFAQKSYTLTGKVLAAEDKVPIPAANIIILNSKVGMKGVSTDIDGNFSLVVTAGDKLQFSYIGYKNQVITITNQKTITVSLASVENELEQVVVIGYGSQKKSHTTGSISKVVNDDLDQIAVARVDDALVGQVSGVNIQSTDGEAGSAPTINIRGVGSMSSGSTPLVVVDGIIVSSDFLGSINMNDVASFEILKDAASSSIYGSKGANGIIMITTKSGKIGKLKMNYSTYFGTKEARKSDAYTFSIAETAAAELAATGTISDQTKLKQRIGVDRSWQDVIFDGGNIINHSLSARGASEKTNYSVGLNYLHDEGILLTDDFKKYGINLKIDNKVNDKLSFGVNLSPSYTKRRRFDGSVQDILRQTNWLPVRIDESNIQFVNPLTYPNVKIGDYAQQVFFDRYNFATEQFVKTGGTTISNTSNINPVAKVAERERYDGKFKMFGSVYGEYEIIDGLKFKSTFSGSYQDTQRSRWIGVLGGNNGASDASMNEITQRETYLLSDNFLSYNKSFNKHDISAIAGFTGETKSSFFSTITGGGYTSDLVKKLSNATIITNADSFDWKKTGLSYTTRLNYAYDNKYLFSFSIRRDGSSIFGKDYKYGNFPAASVGWNVAKESFLSQSKIVNNLKIRASYGVTGNDVLNLGNVNLDNSSTSNSLTTGNALIDNYPSLALLGATSAIIEGNLVGGFNPLNIANPDLQWERLVEFSPGIDYGFLNNRISGSIDYYVRTSDKLLLNNPVSVTTGFNSALVNLGKVKNEGLEFELRTKNISREKFSWSSTFIATTNKNTLVDFADSNGQITNVDSKRASEWINLEGQPISTFYGWVVDKEIPLEYIKNPYHPVGGQAQDVYVKDLNGDGLIDDDDKTALGDPYPSLIWSFTNDFKIGNFGVSFMFQGSHGAEVRNMADQYMFNHFNSSQDFNPATTPNQGFIKEKIFTNSIIQDASYIALRNVNIGYNFSKNALSKMGLSGLNIYVSGQNLMYLTASNYTGWNPESVVSTSPTTYGYQLGGNPIFRTISFGLNLDF